MTVLVTGATGNAGAQVVKELLALGQRVRAVTRNAAAARLPAGVEVVEGDLTRPETIPFDGVTGVHLLSNAGADYAALLTGPELVQRAEKAGVRRITVLWSGYRSPLEEAVTASSLEWTVLRPMDFMSNSLVWAESVRREGVVREPFAYARSALVHEGDIGAVAAAVLVRGGHGGRTYTLTGPEALSVPEQVAAIGAAIGREVTYVEQSEEEARDEMLRAGRPREVVDVLLGWKRDMPAEGYTVVRDVEDVLGRPARSFASWAREHAGAFL
ncbi:NmrA family NAD(P)-binding protein [Lentzea sp. NEAU-D7]|uniref:NmrA family NAD(P)-binding protein n=1 Tax=Lentzea sp. NEAU-D7 TaxID=2994667 RepID=UPI00224ACF16|nr:NmrA family NAD(P)-binding protein [Lentzea sp. NEAU-D7]MCX2947264.1 NmrA family NAD(P)-binding protein [Lentzea sp. NEAU-D7]